MAYNEELDRRISEQVADLATVRKKMFGGTCHLWRGNMMCGVYKDYLILRLGAEQGEAALRQPHVKPFDITGRPMQGWVMVAPDGYQGAALASWLAQARLHAESLPIKK